MSTRSKAKRATQRKPPAAGGDGGRRDRLVQAQRNLDKQADLFRQAQEKRRLEIRRAFEAGMTTQQLSDVLGVSRSKVYELLGGVQGSKPSSSSRAVDEGTRS